MSSKIWWSYPAKEFSPVMINGTAKTWYPHTGKRNQNHLETLVLMMMSVIQQLTSILVQLQKHLLHLYIATILFAKILHLSFFTSISKLPDGCRLLLIVKVVLIPLFEAYIYISQFNVNVLSHLKYLVICRLSYIILMALVRYTVPTI